MADTFTYVPDQGASPQLTPKVNKSQFGDGYQQRSTEGLNPIVEIWTLVFSVRSTADVIAMNVFFKGKAGTTSFYWTTPLGDTALFVCTAWQPILNGPFDNIMQATFERVYESA